jgi:hypothetical protein
MSHNLVVTIRGGGHGLETQLVCHEPEGAPCRKHSYGSCTLVHHFGCDPEAVLEDYRGTEAVALLDESIVVRSTSEFDFSWEFERDTIERTIP